MTAWTLSAKWAAKEIDCTLHGILKKCGGACCKTPFFWPPKASGGVCGNLGPDGCKLGDDKPVTCLLYPFRVADGRLGLYGRALITTCKPCYRSGGQSIAEALRGNFAILFGDAEADRIAAAARDGRDIEIAVPDWVIESLAAEAKWEAASALPPGRAEMAAGDPPRRPEHPSLAALRE